MGKTQLTDENIDIHLKDPRHGFEVPDGPFVIVALNDYGEPQYLGSKDVQIVVVQADVIDPWWATTIEDINQMEREAKFIAEVHELTDDESFLGRDVADEVRLALSGTVFEEMRDDIRADDEIWERARAEEEYGQREASSQYTS